MTTVPTQTQIAQPTVPPFPRFLEVATGLSAWTVEEQTWKRQSPWWSVHEAEANVILAILHDTPDQKHRLRIRLLTAMCHLQQITDLEVQSVAKEYVRALLPDHLQFLFEQIANSQVDVQESTNQAGGGDTQPDPKDSRDELDRLILKALDTLTDEERRVVEMSFLSETQLSDLEIAESLGMTTEQMCLTRDLLIQRIELEVDSSQE